MIMVIYKNLNVLMKFPALIKNFFEEKPRKMAVCGVISKKVKKILKKPLTNGFKCGKI